MRAGRRAFARRGLAGANLRDDVLTPARVSVGSFYHQFEDKADLLLAILRDRAPAARERLGAVGGPRPAKTAASLARRIYAAVQEVAEADPETWRIRSRERWCEDARVRGFLRRERRAWLATLAEAHRGLARSGGLAVDAGQAAECLLGLAAARADARLERRVVPSLTGLVRFTAAGLGGAPAARRRAARRPGR